MWGKLPLFVPPSLEYPLIKQLQPDLTPCHLSVPLQHPMWLELLNMSRSAITPTPVRLILKMGDDLRQDMMTLRMLALFDKVRRSFTSTCPGGR